MTYKLAIFDLDGTLSDSYPWFLRIVNAVADRHRFRRIADSDIDTLRDMGTRDIVRFLEVPSWRLPLIARDMRRLKATYLDEIPLFPGVDRMLESLAAGGGVLAMVSSDNERNVRRALGLQNAKLISHFACGASLFGKARKFRQVLKRADVPPAQAIAIGDEVRDLEAARTAGIAFGAVSWGYASADALRSRAPDHVFGLLDDIVESCVAP